MRAFELMEGQRIFYHGSNDYLPVGSILTPRDDYENDWIGTDFYAVLEKNRPDNMLSHKQSIFMVDNDDDVDVAGGGTEWVFTVNPLGSVQRHDMNWSSEISMLVGDNHGADKENKLELAARNYWNGIAHPNESVWEYLTPKAQIIKVEEF